MTYLQRIQQLSRADFLKSVGLYLTRDRLFFVRMRKDFLRLSVVEEETREIALEKDSDKLATLTGWISEEVREVLLRGELTLSRQALNEAMRSLLPHFDRARDPFFLCLSEDYSIACEISLPQAAEENLPQVLEYEIERLLPFNREQVYYDYLPMGRKGDRIEVLVFAIPKKIVDEILDVLSTFGIKTRAVETTPTALSNYLLFCTGGIEGPTVVLGEQDQACGMVGLNVTAKGWRRVPSISFAHWLPQAEWTEGPSRELFHGLLQGSPKLFGWGHIQDSSISLGGQSLELRNLLALGKQRLNGNKELAHSFFIPAVGAALRGLREATFSVNLLSGADEEEKNETLSGFNTALALLLLIGLLVWGGSYLLKDEIRVRQLQKEVEKVEPLVKALRVQEDELSRVRKEISFLSGMRDRRGEILSILDELSRIVPKGVYLSNLRYRDGTVELQGSAENASNLVPLLERSQLFENVVFNAPSNRGRDNRETFSLKAEVERPKGRASKS
jgi:Tfp pilus assembly protein PilN